MNLPNPPTRPVRRKALRRTITPLEGCLWGAFLLSLTATLLLAGIFAYSLVSAQSIPTPPSLTPPPPPTATFTPSPTPLPSPSPTPTLSPSPAPSETPVPTGTPTPLPPLRFAVIGDYGLAGDPAREVARMVIGWQPDLVITTGDNNYPNGEAETIDDNIGQFYHRFIFPYHGAYSPGADINRFFPSIGNHEYYSAEGLRPYLDYFELPGNERYYDFTWGPVHFFCLNSDPHEPDKVGRSSVQAEWLRQRLAASTLPWKVVYTHFPPYSSGVHGSTDWMQWPFKEWGATVVLAGHDHGYERLNVDGFPYFVNGLGGGPIYPIANSIPGSVVQYDGDYGAMLVEASAERIVFQFITIGGRTVDVHVIERPAP